jgi:hypothetical protein
VAEGGGLLNRWHLSRRISACTLASGFLRVFGHRGEIISQPVSPRATELGGNSGGKRTLHSAPKPTTALVL